MELKGSVCRISKDESDKSPYCNSLIHYYSVIEPFILNTRKAARPIESKIALLSIAIY